jgi:hypothetical protein
MGLYPYGSPGAALEAHLRRLSAVEKPSPLAIRATAALLRSISRRLHGGAEAMLANEAAILDRAVTHYVSPDLVDLALNDDRPPRPLDLSWLPSAGIALFGKPVIIQGYPEGALRMAACAWSINQVSVTARTKEGSLLVPDGEVIGPDPNDPDAVLVPGLVLLCYLSIADSEPYLTGASFGEDHVAVEEMRGGLDLLRGLGDLALYDVQGWAAGTSWQEGPASLFDDEGARTTPAGDVTPVVAQLRLFLQAFWSLLDEHIVVADRPDFDRPTRRRLARFGRSLEEDGGIKVLRLRRVDYPLGYEPRPKDSGWTLDHRIIVREHTKRVRYKDANGAWAYRRVRIAPHVRGPEDAPLILKHNLTVVAR